MKNYRTELSECIVVREEERKWSDQLIGDVPDPQWATRPGYAPPNRFSPPKEYLIRPTKAIMHTVNRPEFVIKTNERKVPPTFQQLFLSDPLPPLSHTHPVLLPHIIPLSLSLSNSLPPSFSLTHPLTLSLSHSFSPSLFFDITIPLINRWQLIL